MCVGFGFRIVRKEVFCCVVATLMCVASAWAQTDANKAKGDDKAAVKYGVNKPLGDTYTSVSSVAHGQARVVLYRSAADANKGGVITTYLNDHYHASLQKNAYAVICLGSKKIDVRTRYLADHVAQVQPELDTRRTQDIVGGDSVFLRISSKGADKSIIEPVSPEVAVKDLDKARRQMHTLSRVPGAQPCREADAPQPVADPNVITFGLDTIFEPKKTDIQSLSTAGKRELNLIVQKINVKYKSFKDVKVHVVGYADDETDENGNQQISHERAKTVRTYFKAQGIRASALTFEGRGSQDKRKAEILGLSPRRVEVEVAVEIR